MKLAYLLLFLIFLIPQSLAIDFNVGEEAKLLITVTDVFGNPVGNYNCSAVCYYPNNTLFFNVTMNKTGAIYWVEFTAPSRTGVYPCMFSCLNAVSLGSKRLAKYSYFRVINYTANLQALEQRLNQTINQLQEKINNISLQIIANVTANVTGNLSTIPDDVWERYVQYYPYLKDVKKLSNHNFCSPDNTTLIHNITYSYCLPNGRCGNVSYLQYEPCEYGCNPELKECNPAPVSLNLLGFGVIILLSFLIYIFY